MHYKNGREAKVGDKIVGKDCVGNPYCGVVIGTYPTADRCNLQVAPANNFLTASADECLHVDDAGLGRVEK